jgi:YqaJ-like viral recombinase domain
MIEIIRPADRDAWLRARKCDITASIAGALLGAHPYTSAYQIWAEKTGRVEQTEETAAMRRGTIFEPIAIELLRHVQPEWVIEYPLRNAYYRDVKARLGATPDAFYAVPDHVGIGVAQVKTVARSRFKEGWLDPLTEKPVLPIYVAVQAIVEADLTGANFACVPIVVTPFDLEELIEGLEPAKIPDIARTLRDVAFAWLATGKLEIHVLDVPVHAGVKRKVRSAVDEFWKTVDAAEHPPIDWKHDGGVVLDVYRSAVPNRKDLTGDPAIDTIVTEFKNAKEQEAATRQLIDELKPQIIYALGDAELGMTDSWELFARSQSRGDTEFRPLRVKPRSQFDGHF